MSMSSEEGVLELRRVPSWVTDRGYDTEFERNLLVAVHQEDIDEFRDLVERSEIDFSKYNTAINTCMELCCNRPGYGEFIEILLSARFNPNAIIMHPGITAIHLATINGNYTALEALLAHRRTNVNMISGHGKVAIHYVAERVPVSADDEETVAKCIGVLLSHPDIDVNKCSITDWTLNGNVLHLAARCDNYVVVKALLEDGRIDFNSEDTYGWTALHYAVRHCRNTKDIEDISRNCCLLLLSDPDVDVNKRTSKLTFKIKAVHLAAAVGNDVALEALIKDKRTNVGALDSRKRNALHYVSEQSLQRLEIAKRDKLAIASTVHFSEIDFNSPDFYEWIAMHSAASKGNFAYVIVMLQEDGGTELNSAEINKRLLSRSSNRSFTNEEHEERIRRCISLLIDHPDIDANQYSSMRLIDNVTPLILAAKAGNYVALEELIKSRRIDVDMVDPNKRTLLHYAVEQYDSERAQKCIALLLQRTEKVGGTLEMPPRYMHDINSKDADGNTALHVAALRKAQTLILSLLRNGASIALRGKKGSPVPYISPKVFEVFLNECLETNGKSSEDEHFQLIFSYKFLVRNDSVSANYFPESDPLYRMSLGKKTRHLLKHPVLKSFLDLKWRRVRNYFYVNVVYHVFFVILLNLFIVDRVRYPNYNATNSSTLFSAITFRSSIAEMNRTTETPNSGIVAPLLENYDTQLVFWVILKICVAGLLVKELFQLLVSPFRYVWNIDNYVELLLIAGTLANMYSPMLINPKVVPHLAAVTILLSWTQLMFLTGRLPMLSIQLEMLKQVSWTFIRFLAWYSFILIAFALSFYTLFYDEKNKSIYRKEGSISNFFMDPFTALLKTVIMMAGEFEGSYIPFMLNPGTSHVVFVIFLFLVAIVMLNLLNGLAVSDTQYIRQEAEVLSLVSRVRLIYYIESMLLGDPQSSCWMGARLFRYLRNTCACFRNIHKNILLFPHVVLENKIWVLPNRDNRVVFVQPLNMANEHIQVSYIYERSCFKYLTLDPSIVKSAIDIINSREVSENNVLCRPIKHENMERSMSFFDSHMQRLTKDIESKISDNEKRLQNSIEKNLELIRRNIEAEVGELEVKMKSKLDNARRAEQENKALLHNILQQLKRQGKPS